MCAATDEEARELADGWTFFIFASALRPRRRRRAGQATSGRSIRRGASSDKAKGSLDDGLIGSPETMRKKLRQFAESRVDQVILLNQAGKTTHKAICDSLELFAREVMPEFHALEPSMPQWKRKVMAREIVLEDLDVQKYDIYSHQNEHIVRLTPEQLKAKMAEKEAAVGQVILSEAKDLMALQRALHRRR